MASVIIADNIPNFTEAYFIVEIQRRTDLSLTKIDDNAAISVPLIYYIKYGIFAKERIYSNNAGLVRIFSTFIVGIRMHFYARNLRARNPDQYRRGRD